MSDSPPRRSFLPPALSDVPEPQEVVALGRRVLRGLVRHHAFDHAAAMSFYFFLGIIPLLVVAGVGVGAFVEAHGVEQLAGPLFQVMPSQVATLVRDELHNIAEANLRTLGPISFVGFMVLTSNGVHNLMDVFELVSKAPSRPWFRQRLLSLLWVAGLLVVTGIAVALLFWADKLFNGPPPPEVPTFAFRVGRALANGWNRLGVAAVFFTLSTGGLALFYRFGIRHPASVRRRVWPGTIAAMLGWLFVSLLFSAYVRGIGSYAVYYGSLATVATFLIWLYLTSLCFMVGAEVNAILEGVRNEGDEGAPPSVPPFSTRSRSLR